MLYMAVSYSCSLLYMAVSLIFTAAVLTPLKHILCIDVGFDRTQPLLAGCSTRLLYCWELLTQWQLINDEVGLCHQNVYSRGTLSHRHCCIKGTFVWSI